MITLFEQNLTAMNRQSSKGNQLKWLNGNIWYKADYTGYEGLAEYVVSHLLQHASLSPSETVVYETEKIMYKSQQYLGCKSHDFLPDNWQMLTLERLFHNNYGISLYQSIYRIQGIEERIQFLVNQVVRMTGLTDFGIYLSKLLTIDAFFLNEDRHTHNIAVLLDSAGLYHYCPIFDNGASLLSDTTMDYPMETELYTLLPAVSSKTVCSDFDEQLDAVEHLYGQHIQFQFNIHTVEELLHTETCYPDSVKTRILAILGNQIHKYTYLFS